MLGTSSRCRLKCWIGAATVTCAAMKRASRARVRRMVRVEILYRRVLFKGFEGLYPEMIEVRGIESIFSSEDWLYRYMLYAT